MKKIVGITGTTCVGKSAVAVELAKILQTEIVSADSMQIYKGMDIATAKPTQEEMQGIPHHLISMLEVTDFFSVADYMKLAQKKISEITERGRLPILVGGTGLYVSSLIDNITFDNALTDGGIRKKLNEQGAEYGGEYMLERLREIDPETADKLPAQNLTRIIRAIEVYEITGIPFSKHKEMSRQEPIYDACIIGLNYTDRSILYERINKRVDIMLENGLLDECRAVYDKKQLGTVCQAIGYKEFIPYFKGERSKEECIDKIKQYSRNYAKRQLTWFRRDERIMWVEIAKDTAFSTIIADCKKIVAKNEFL